MPKYGVEWSLQGYSVVEAATSEEAEIAVSEMADEALLADVQGFDVSDVEEEEEAK